MPLVFRKKCRQLAQFPVLMAVERLVLKQWPLWRLPGSKSLPSGFHELFVDSHWLCGVLLEGNG